MRVFAFLAFFILQGCVVRVGDHTPSVVTQVSSLASPESSALKLYKIMPSSQDVSEHSLQFKEYSSYVNRLLKMKGFELAGDHQVPEIIVFIGYGVGEPEESYYSYDVPIIGTAPTGSYSVSTIGSTTTVTEHKALTVTGYSSHTRKKTSFTKHFEITAMSVAAYLENEEFQPIWETTVISRGREYDLRYVFPYLVAASKDYIGRDSGRIVSVQIRQDNLVKRYIEGLESIVPST